MTNFINQTEAVFSNEENQSNIINNVNEPTEVLINEETSETECSIIDVAEPEVQINDENIDQASIYTVTAKAKAISQSVIVISIDKLKENAEAKKIYSKYEIKSLSSYYLSNNENIINPELITVNSNNEVIFLNDVFRDLKSKGLKNIKVIKINSSDIDIQNFIFNNINKYSQYQSYFYLGMQIVDLIEKAGGKQQGKANSGSIWEKIKKITKVNESKARKLELVFSMYPDYLKRLDKNINTIDNSTDDETVNYKVSLNMFYKFCLKFKKLETDAITFGFQDKYETCLKNFILKQDNPEDAYNFLSPFIQSEKLKSNITDDKKPGYNAVIKVNEMDEDYEDSLIHGKMLEESLQELRGYVALANNKKVDEVDDDFFSDMNKDDTGIVNDLIKDEKPAAFENKGIYYIPCNINGHFTNFDEVIKACFPNLYEKSDFQKATAEYMKAIEKSIKNS